MKHRLVTWGIYSKFKVLDMGIKMNKKYLLFVALFFSINSYADDFETEPNNSKEEADPIFSGIPMNASIFGTGDKDWFFFETKQSDVLSITPNKRVGISIYDNKENLLYNENNVFGKNTVKIGISEAGKYFVVMRHSTSEEDYSVLMNLENTDPHSTPDISSGTVSLNLDIHMPSLDYQSLAGNQNIWADFSYSGLNGEGEHIWVLKKYGANE